MATALKPYVENLQKELTCSICHDIFKDPKTLPCLHNFCSKCIESSEDQATKGFICPMCRTQSHIPDSGASKLRSSFYVEALLQLFETMRGNPSEKRQVSRECENCNRRVVVVAFCPQCKGLICSDCVNAHNFIKQIRAEHQPTMLEDFKQDNVDSFVKSQMICKESFHAEKNKLEYFCQEEACKRCICQKCAILYHQNHRIQSLEEAAEEVKQIIKQDINRVDQLKEGYEEELKQSKENIERIQNEIELAKKAIHDDVEAIFDIVRYREATMFTILDNILVDQKIANDDEQTDINIAMKNVREFQSHSKKMVDKNLTYEIIKSKEVNQQRCESLLETPLILCHKPIQRNVTVHYVTNHQVIQSLQDIGTIVISMTDPSRCTFESLNEAKCGFENHFNIITRNAEGEVCHTRLESIDIKIKDVEGNAVEKKVFGEQNGKFRVTYRALRPGTYEIHVNIGGEPIKDSPQIVYTLDFTYVKTFGEEGQDKGQLHFPRSVAVNDNEEMAIADGGNNRIQVFGLNEIYLREFGERGTEEGKLLKPFGVVFIEDRVIVSDQPDTKGRMQEFDLNGTYLRTLFRPDQWFAPCGMCVNRDGNIAVCCQGNEVLGIKPNIKLFSKQGDLIHEFDVTDDEQPRYITYGNGKYFVSYINKNIVRVFDYNGKLLYGFGEEGEGHGEFKGVGGLAVYGPDMILVCDMDNHRVQLLSQEGQFIMSFGSRGSGVGQMYCPVDLVVTADGKVFVLQCGTKQIQIWC